ncbi:hypothetical protein AB833_20015 [Chromatiales bacterium (ex Bugula neritina AB1)]|nr:hypothetical protein AB833_20015 [Chromatiales bacterium (ex Bugula neritina AB1)]
MGTVVTVCMFIAVLFASGLLNRAPRTLKLLVTVVIGAAGSWNVLWYALRNIPEKWGWLAFVSGILMIITACYISLNHQLPKPLQSAKLPVLVALTACAIYYAQTIYHL